MTILTTSSFAPVPKPAPSASPQRLGTAAAAIAAAPVPATESIPRQVQAVAPQLEQVQRAIERLRQSIKPALANSLEFQIDQSTGKTIVKILDSETNTVVRQIPSEEILTIARALDRMQGRGGLLQEQA